MISVKLSKEDIGKIKDLISIHRYNCDFEFQKNTDIGGVYELIVKLVEAGEKKSRIIERIILDDGVLNKLIERETIDITLTIKWRQDYIGSTGKNFLK